MTTNVARSFNIAATQYIRYTASKYYQKKDFIQVFPVNTKYPKIMEP